MRKLRPLFIAAPAFVLGCFVTAGLTTTAQAQEKAGATREAPLYRIATNEAEINRYAGQGYAVKEATGTANYVSYLMQRYR